MENIFVYKTKLPSKIKEMVSPCIDGYTIYIDESLDHESMLAAYNHAIKHIKSGDFDRYNIQEIESEAHQE